MHGFPHVCISIGLIYEKSPVLGVIYNPFLDQLYYAAKGQGAYLVLRGRGPLKLPLSAPRPLPSLSQSLIGESYGKYVPYNDAERAQASNGAQTDRRTLSVPRAMRSNASPVTPRRASKAVEWPIHCVPWGARP